MNNTTISSKNLVPSSSSRSYRLLSPMRRICVGFFRVMPQFFAKKLMDWFRYSNSTFGFGIRYLCLHRLAKCCGEKVIIFPVVFIYYPEELDIGTNVSIHEFTYIDAKGGLTIGDDVGIGHGCTIVCGQHSYNKPGKRFKESGYIAKPVNIGNDVWLGSHVRALQGVKIGKGSIVGASSVVTKDIPEYSIAVGIPAKVIRKRFEEDNVTSN